MPTEAWTQADSDAARSEGWFIDDETRLCATVQAHRFEDDTLAWLTVVRAADRGSSLHRRALDLIRERAPSEYSAIMRYWSIYRHI